MTRQQEINASRAEWAYYRLALQTAGQPGSWPPPHPQELEQGAGR